MRFDGYFITEQDLNRAFEFILLSERKDPMPRSELFEEGPSLGTTWNMFWVMLIERDADGVAERRGTGQIYQKVVNDSLDPGPVWKETFPA